MQERHCYSDVMLFQHSQQARAYGGGTSARGNNRRWKVGQGGSLHAHAAHPCTLSPMLLTPAHFRPCATGFCHPGGAGRCPCRIGDDAAAPAAGAPSDLVGSRDVYLGAPSALQSRVNWLSVNFCVLGWYLSQSHHCLPPPAGTLCSLPRAGRRAAAWEGVAGTDSALGQRSAQEQRGGRAAPG